MKKHILFLFLLSINFLSAQSKSLKVPKIPQIQDKVCWAASIEMILKAHEIQGIDQCQIIKRNSFVSNYVRSNYSVLNTSNCSCSILCGDVDRLSRLTNCNIPLVQPLNWMQSELDMFNFDAIINNNINFIDIKMQIDNSKPLIIWKGGSHILVIKGYVQGPNILTSLIVNDPYTCQKKIREIFYYTPLRVISNMNIKGSSNSSVKTESKIDTCFGGIRNKLKPVDINNLMNNRDFEVVDLLNSGLPQKQVIFCKEKCDSTILTLIVKESLIGDAMWRPIEIDNQNTNTCRKILKINNKNVILSNNKINMSGADTTISYKKVVLYPYNYELYVFEFEGRILYTPSDDNFFQFKKNVVYTPIEVLKEYSLNLYIDYIKNNIEFNLPDSHLPYLPKTLKEFSLKMEKSASIVRPFFDEYKKFDSINDMKNLESLLKNYPNIINKF